MKSFPDKVQLPSFQDMMRVRNGPLIDDPDPMEETEISYEAQQAQSELIRTQELCANMRREALTESEKLVEQARQEAVSIKDKARREVVEQARRELETEKQANKQALLDAVRTLEAVHKGLFDEIEPRLLDAAFYTAELVLQYELDRSNDAYHAIVRNTLNLLYTDGKPRTLHMSPRGYDRLIGSEGSTVLVQMQEAGVTVLRDAALPEGDCMVESAVGGIRGGVYTQLSRMRYATSTELEGGDDA